MATITIKGYQMPYDYSSNDRFYMKENGDVSLPSSVWDYTIDINTLSDKWPLSFNIITLLSGVLIKKGNPNFNYVSVEGVKHNDRNISYWFVNGSSYIAGSDAYTYMLYYDILMSMPLLKNIDKDIKISLDRVLYSALKKDDTGDNLILKDERNPELWNNSEFSDIFPNKMSKKQFNFNPLFEPSDNFYPGSKNNIVKVREKFKDLKLAYDFNIEKSNYTYEEWSGGLYSNKVYSYTNKDNKNCKGTIPLSPVIELINAVFHSHPYNIQYSEVANISSYNEKFVSQELNVFSLNKLKPIFYPRIENLKDSIRKSFIIKTHTKRDGSKEYLTSELMKWNEIPDDSFIKKIMSYLFGNSNFNSVYTCQNGYQIDFNNREHLTFLTRILMLLLNNSEEYLAQDVNVSQITIYTHWLNIDSWEGIHNDIPNDTITLDRLFYFDENVWKIMDNGNAFKQGAYIKLDDNFKGIHLLSNKQDFYPDNGTISKKYTPTLSVGKKIVVPITADLFTIWELYKYSQMQFFNNSYAPTYLDYLGLEIPLEKENIFKYNKIVYKTWIGTATQNMSLYLGNTVADTNNKDKLFINDPQKIKKMSVELPAEFRLDNAALTYALKRNVLGAKQDEINLAQDRDVSYVENYNNLRKQKLNATLLAQNLNRDEITTINNRTRQAQNTINKNTKQLNYYTSWFSVSGIVSNFQQGFPGFMKYERELVASNLLTGEANLNATLQNTANKELATALAEVEKIALNSETEAQVLKINQDARIKQSLLNAEIKDIQNIPDQIKNSSNLTRLTNLGFSNVSLITRFFDENIHKKLWRYGNLFGIPAWKELEFETNWYNNYTIFNYFKGGNWDDYLTAIGVFSKEIRNEFNALLSTGLRLYHQKYKIGSMTSKNDIISNVPNWEKQLVERLLT